MAVDFKISYSLQNTDVHLHLSGNFDGNSALEILHFLKENCNGFNNIFIHTCGLKEIYPFGRDVFLNNFRFMNGRNIRVKFAGENANKIAPMTG